MRPMVRENILFQILTWKMERFSGVLVAVMLATSVNFECYEARMLGKTGLDMDYFGDSLKTSHGNAVSPNDLKDVSVGLIFGAAWCPSTQRFFPELDKWYKEANKGGAKKVELVYVSSDTDKKEYDYYRQQWGEWLALDYGDPLGEKLKEKFAVFSHRELGDRTRASGIPCLVVVNREGDQISFLPGEDVELSKWKYNEDGYKFG